ncbi:unnamed protein product [Blumeria hordei]|uniref:Uncharacterized protein n=1 Tax=Blumeria hordei TaxID=2867405 RepID=A0A383V034_BLUHO|nr:unnamed protein product [Blumeria hordei]
MKLPDLAAKPGYDVLMSTLISLRKKNKATDESTSDEDTGNFKIAKRAGGYENSFLLNIIRSDLGWISSENRDIVYDAASKYMAEKCGRAAMPEMSRTWAIPTSGNQTEINFTLREPSMTGDNLGLKTWATSFVVAKDLISLGRDYFRHLLDPCGDDTRNLAVPQIIQSCARILELGSGTGLLGMAAAAIWGTSVLSTDIQAIQENLLFNIRENLDKISLRAGASISCQTLDWRFPEQTSPMPQAFELILVADPLYDDIHPLALAHTIDYFLQKNSCARVLIAVPYRDEHTIGLFKELEGQMFSRNFELVVTDSKVCRDKDWAVKAVTKDVMVNSTIWKRRDSTF